MNDADALLIAGEIAATAGVDQEACSDAVSAAGAVARLDRHEVGSCVVKFGDGETFADLRAGLLRVSQQQLIEARALDLERRRLPGVMSVAEDQFQAFRAIAHVELRAGFEREAFLLQ